jgi:hypothetical protein
MVKCPFCQFDNEDGALFCEQCKSDLAGAEPIPVGQPLAESHVVEAIPIASSMPEAIPIMADALVSSTPPLGVPVCEPVALSVPDPVAEPMPSAHIVTSEPPLVPLGSETSISPATPAGGSPGSLATMAATPVTAPPGLAPRLKESSVLPAEAQPRLLVLRGQKRNVEYPLYEGLNFIGRADEKPVDIDLEDQEPPDRVWCSRQHCLITFEEGKLNIEDLNSANGTFVNRTRIYPGKSQPLNVNDVVQIGNVQLRVIV